MKIFLFVLNNLYARIVLGVIVAGTVASPFMNGYTHNFAFPIIAIIIAIAFIFSLIFEYEVPDTTFTRALILLFVVAYLVLIACLFIQWGHK